MKKSYKPTPGEWDLLFRITDAAKMDWFYEDFNSRKTIDLVSMADAGCAFLETNLEDAGFNSFEALRLYTMFVRVGCGDSCMERELLRFLKDRPVPGDEEAMKKTC